MTNLVIAGAIVVVVGCVALALRRRRTVDVPTQRSFTVPTQIDRRDFEHGERNSIRGTAAGSEPTPWLIVVFTSASCHVCSDIWDKAQVLRSRHVTVRRADFEEEREIHRRYGIDAVPTVVICDELGVVRHHFLGPVSATDLWAAMARLRGDGDFEDRRVGT